MTRPDPEHATPLAGWRLALGQLPRLKLLGGPEWMVGQAGLALAPDLVVWRHGAPSDVGEATPRLLHEALLALWCDVGVRIVAVDDLQFAAAPSLDA